MSVPFITMDTTAVTLDSTTAFTWDADVSLGYVGLTDDAGDSRYVIGNVRLDAIAFDRTMYRNPYGASWFQAGRGTIGAQLIRVALEVWSDSGGIASAHSEVEALRAIAEEASIVRAPFGSYYVIALQSWSRSPIEAGYRVEAVFVTDSGRS